MSGRTVPRTRSARVTSIAHHDSGVSRITLAVPASFRHQPGQYLNVVHPDGGVIPLSIASAPARLPELELHYRPTPGIAAADLMNDLLASNATTWRLDGPHGDVIVEGPTPEPLWLIAGGTGIAQCLCITEHLEGTAQTQPVNLLWSVTVRAQLYCDLRLRAFARWLSYSALIDAPGSTNAAVAWLHRTGVVVSGRVVLSGGPGFVYSVYDELTAIAAAGTTFESDVFAYAPRS